VRIHHPPSSTLLPYTTLFRSLQSHDGARLLRFYEPEPSALGDPLERLFKSEADANAAEREIAALERRQYKGVFHITLFKKPHLRSEEHTSELQSRENLVCRLL